MTSLTERLRAVIGSASRVPAAHVGAVVEPAAHAGPEGEVERPTDAAIGATRAAARAAEVLGGEWQECGPHRFLVVDRRYAPGHRHGRVLIADCLPPAGGTWPGLRLLCEAATSPRDGSRLLFVDLETTGLAGGAGTYAFLVGCAWFDGGVFRTRQLFLSAFTSERLLLETLAREAAEAAVVVSYNGKTFDLPLIETRYLFHRMTPPFAGVPHVDMLHPARRLWRADVDADGGAASCRLSVLERMLCGHAREDDVAGFEIPSRYFRYVHTGDPRPLAAVFEHNRLDLLALALLTARAAQLLDEGAPAARTAREALGLGRLYERGGMKEEALACFERAAGMHDADARTRAEALRSLAVLCRRNRHHAAAADAWRRVLALDGCPPHLRREAAEALAVHHEHRLRDPLSARGFALQSLALPASPARRGALEHRLARLSRKLSRGEAPAQLF